MSVARKHTGIRKLPTGRFRARYFAGYTHEGKRIYPARTFDTEAEARKWRSEGIANRIDVKHVRTSLAQQYSQGAVYTTPFTIPNTLKSIRRELVELHLPLARICCVYFLIDSDNDVVYVGQTTDLHLRIKGHQRAKMPFSRVMFLPVQAIELTATEAYFIRTLKPWLNKRAGWPGIWEPVESVRDLVASDRGSSEFA